LNKKLEEQELIIYAFRYALGRRSIAPYNVISAIRSRMKKIGDEELTLISREIREAIKNYKAGDPNIDAPMWQQLANDIDQKELKEA